MKTHIGIFCLLLIFSCQKPSDTDLTIAVASNMQFPMIELTKIFEKQAGISCDLVVSSSGKLTAQIKEGAPFDLLVSADMKYPNELFRSGLTRRKPMVYAYGQLVLLSVKGDNKPTVNDLTSSHITHIALPNPKTAPYGKAAIEFLEYQGILDSIRHKLVYGESVSQVNQFILSGAAQVGFTSESVIHAPALIESSSWMEIDDSEYTPISQGVVILDNENSAKSGLFLEFLFSPEGQEVLHKYGYKTELSF